MVFHSREEIRTWTGLLRGTELRGAGSGGAATCLNLVKKILLVSHSESSTAPWCGASPVLSPLSSGWRDIWLIAGQFQKFHFVFASFSLDYHIKESFVREDVSTGKMQQFSAGYCLFYPCRKGYYFLKETNMKSKFKLLKGRKCARIMVQGQYYYLMYNP